ncbi:hypothetical protein [Brachybacterium hainanense]|uniref:Uncharacterized protein n=1 Tax=Brachybacterium hainanense TaxID=1541174 RepID=A0ABV6R805_9MICO
MSFAADDPWNVGPDPLAHGDIADEHADAYALSRLSQLAMRRAGFVLEADEAAALDEWLADLRAVGAVIDYLPRTRQGFFLVYARDGIDTDVVRAPS